MRSTVINPFRDKDGKIVIAQKPNWQIIAALVARLLQAVAPEGNLENGFRLAFQALLIIWAYEEILRGVNYFRKFLGLIVLLLTFLNMFAQVS